MTTSNNPLLPKKSKHSPPAKKFGQCIITVLFNEKKRDLYVGDKKHPMVVQKEEKRQVWTGKWVYHNKDKQTFLTPRQAFRMLRITGADEIVEINDKLYYNTNFTAGTKAYVNQSLGIVKGSTKRLQL